MNDKVNKPSEASQAGDQEHGAQILISSATERAEVRKRDYWLLPFMSIMYFFNAVDRSNLGNAETDGMSKDLGFVGEQYSLLILLFYIPNGLCDLPLNLLTKRYSGRIVLPALMVGRGVMALLQAACTNFGGMLAIRLILGCVGLTCRNRASEAGFFAGAVFYVSLVYTRGELGFRIALFFGSALLASAFSGSKSFGVFRIRDPHVHGWMLLFIIEDMDELRALTMIFGVVPFWWLPASPKTAWFLNPAEREVVALRSLRDGTRDEEESFSIKECFRTWNDWEFPMWCVISLTYPVAFATGQPERDPIGGYVSHGEQGVSLRAEDVETRELKGGEEDPR
ncbi:Major facilitator-type transporter hxnP [Colletotrichum spinosum]|uniref:Major facilitator-type transporter hxnP n=1 Tax=Colletotrichum spinosum TaxID=1347390 RepID=A0A4R8QM37_9PEZI|nr:Major facilitator-type transporter hxnP [Colletotrichum spinosum]